jgi:hypothetical protein
LVQSARLNQSPSPITQSTNQPNQPITQLQITNYLFPPGRTTKGTANFGSPVSGTST